MQEHWCESRWNKNYEIKFHLYITYVLLHELSLLNIQNNQQRKYKSMDAIHNFSNTLFDLVFFTKVQSYDQNQHTFFVQILVLRNFKCGLKRRFQSNIFSENCKTIISGNVWYLFHIEWLGDSVCSICSHTQKMKKK